MDSDKLFQAHHTHVDGADQDCASCDVDRIVPGAPRKDEMFKLHFGTITSVEQVIMDARIRDRIRDNLGSLCVEMEAVGILSRQNCLVIRGISGYSNSHKNDI